MEGALGVVCSDGEFKAGLGPRHVSQRRRSAAKGLVFVVPLLATCFATSCLGAASSAKLVTWPGWEPDKGASLWYWKRFVDPRVHLIVVPTGETSVAGIYFDTPNGTFRRTQNSSTFEAILRAHPSDDAAILKLAALTRDIEINAWRPRALPQSTQLEAAFRRLRARWASADPPATCVTEFFDHVHRWLTGGGSLDEVLSRACMPAERGKLRQ